MRPDLALLLGRLESFIDHRHFLWFNLCAQLQRPFHVSLQVKFSKFLSELLYVLQMADSLAQQFCAITERCIMKL